MIDQNCLNSDENEDDSIAIDAEECDAEECFTQFSVETEETMNDAERERWRRNSKKYENLIDRLFDEDEDEEHGFDDK